MKYTIEINKIKYTIKTLSDLTIKEYNSIFNIIKENDFYSLLYMLTDIPVEIIKIIPKEKIEELDWKNILNETKVNKIKTSYLGKKLINLDNIIVSRYIDIDYYLTNENIDDKLQKLMALMLLEKDFNSKDLENIIKEINKLSIKDILPVINYITSWRNNKLKQYGSLFKIEDDEEYNSDDDYEADEEIIEEPEQVDDYGWLGICYEFSKDFYYINNKNIFDAELTSLLNWMSWYKQKQEKELEAQKKMYNKHTH